MTTPKVYASTFAKYNNGSLEGEWIELSGLSNEDDFLEACKAIHDDEEQPEFMFQDFEGFPESYYSKTKLSDELWPYIELLDQLSDETQIRALNAYIEDGNDLSSFEDAYEGQYDSESDFAWQLADSMGYFSAMKKAGMKSYYFDVNKFANDLFICDYTMIDNFVFRNI